MEQNTKTDTSYMEAMLENYNELMADKTSDENPGITDEEAEKIASTLPDVKSFTDGLPVLKAMIKQYGDNVEDMDRRVKQWQASKKMWQNRSDGLLCVVGKLLGRFGMPKGVKEGDVKIAVSSRTSLEVDEDWLLGFSMPLVDSLASALPPYVTVKLSIDKNKLARYLKDDDSLLVDNPDKIHTKTTTSTSIK